MPYAELPVLSIYFERSGNGVPLLLLPGTNADLRRLPRWIDALCAHFDVLTLDQRGLGRSGKPPGPYSMSDYAADAAILMDHAGWLRAAVLGISFGGAVALHLALSRPERVARLALAGANPGGACAYPLHELEDVTPEQRAQVILELDKRRTREWQYANAARARALKDDIIARGFPLDLEDREARAGLRRQLAARAEHDVLAQLGELAMPVGLFAGRYDGLATLQAQHAMRDAISGATLELFEGGHGFLNEDPAAMPAVVRFLASIAAPTGNATRPSPMQRT
jgi:3-oxoadipate enol-lactonase